jgi:hypothetical protein
LKKLRWQYGVKIVLKVRIYSSETLLSGGFCGGLVPPRFFNGPLSVPIAPNELHLAVDVCLLSAYRVGCMVIRHPGDYADSIHPGLHFCLQLFAWPALSRPFTGFRSIAM